jgi:hypothetical protein
MLPPVPCFYPAMLILLNANAHEMLNYPSEQLRMSVKMHRPSLLFRIISIRFHTTFLWVSLKVLLHQDSITNSALFQININLINGLPPML